MVSINDMVTSTVPRRVQAWLGIGIALGLAAALITRVDPHWYWPGLVVSLLGLFMGVWVLGSVRSRKLLPVNGPYKFVRNPHYIAGLVFTFGLVLMAGDPALFLIYVPLYAVYVAYRVGQEEELMEEKFGTEYRRYCKEVPRFIPRLKPYEKGRLWYFSTKHFKRQYGEILLVLSALLYAAGYVAASYFS